MNEGVFCIPGQGGAGKICAEPCTFVILGGTGDLSKRKLLPAIYEILRQGLVPQPVHIVGAAGSALTAEVFRTQVESALRTFHRGELRDDELRGFLARTHYQQVKFEDRASFFELRTLLDRLENEIRIPNRYVFYLATPPSAYADIIDNLEAVGLTASHDGRWPKIVVEKPFGHDLASAVALNKTVLRVFREEQVFRIDHYLGKETVQNIMVLRFANGIFEPTWNRRYVDHVQITVAEEDGIGSRGRYYEESGAIRDMVQNHMLQLLALVAMEPSTSFNADVIRDEKVKVLRSIRPISPETVNQFVVRGQYSAGTQNGEKTVAYQEETHVAPGSLTETFISAKLYVENWRWAGVPFYLRTGKRLAKRVSEICIQYRDVPIMMFRSLLADTLEPSSLILRIQPNEGVSLRFGTKHPGMLMDIRTQSMDFNYYDAYGDKAPDAYERLLLDVIVGDGTLFPRTDAVEESWRFVDRIVQGWKESRVQRLPQYDPGSWGPYEAVELIAAEKRKWRRP